VRLFLCAAAMLMSSVIHADTTRMTSISATHFTDESTLEFIIKYNQPPDLLGEKIYLGSIRNNVEGFVIRNGEWTSPISENLFKGRYFVASSTPAVFTDLGILPHTLNEHTLTLTATLDVLGVTLTEDTYWEVGLNDYVARGSFSHDERVVVLVPEPSSIALASIGVVGLLVHRIRRRKVRTHTSTASWPIG
jgi:hypothetical protein